MYAAIQHFADGITALPRDYRRHISLLKEVDAKAWHVEENLKGLLAQCASNRSTLNTPPTLQSAAASTTNPIDEANSLSAANSAVGAPQDDASQHSNQSATLSIAQRRQLFQALRHNLMQIMVTMDEKNHVINNANEELSRHIRRLDGIWPHISDEISEEAMCGSLKHWAYTETNPTKKNITATRREAAANLAMLHDSEVAQRSESRREAVAAKSKRILARIDAGFAEINTNTKKVAAAEKRRAAEADEGPGLGITGVAKARKPRLGGTAMEKSLSAAIGGRAMSREPSQQENGRKRKAPAATSAVARKRSVLPSIGQASTHLNRLNVNQDSPRLVSSPLASTFGKDAYRRSPALAAARPATSRGRQNSAQTGENSRVRPPSASVRNGVSASTPELHSVAAVTGKTANEVKHTMRETTTSKGDRMLEDDTPNGGNNDAGIRGGLLLEHPASKQGGTRDLNDSAKAVNSPRLVVATVVGRGRASKTSTPVVGTFAEAELTSTGENGNGYGKSKRPARPRVKDQGLQDSLSPKGLPLKRSHKKGAGQVTHQQSAGQRSKQDLENTVPAEDGEEVEEEFGEDEEKYCYCHGPSYGEMIACDNPKCPREWFHLECIGLKNAPKSEKWFCDDCAKLVKRNGNGR